MISKNKFFVSVDMKGISFLNISAAMHLHAVQLLGVWWPASRTHKRSNGSETDRTIDSFGDNMKFLDADLGGPIPWMAETKEDDETTFAIKIGSEEANDVEVPWSDDPQVEFSFEMQNIKNSDGAEIEPDGEHTVPFWAAVELQNLMKNEKLPKAGKWFEVVYKRSEYEKWSKKQKKLVNYNTAAFGVPE